jgi:hypothetical protein
LDGEYRVNKYSGVDVSPIKTAGETPSMSSKHSVQDKVEKAGVTTTRGPPVSFSTPTLQPPRPRPPRRLRHLQAVSVYSAALAHDVPSHSEYTSTGSLKSTQWSECEQTGSGRDAHGLFCSGSFVRKPCS